MLAGKLEGGKFQITNSKFQINSNDQNFNALNHAYPVSTGSSDSAEFEGSQT